MFEFLVLIGGPLVLSAAAGFALNRLIVGRLDPGPAKSLALAASRAVFYAPALVHLGHGFYIPGPLLLVIFYSFREFGPDLDVLVFLIPAAAFLSSLAAARLARRMR